jgi:hypothetical protein
VGEVESFTHQEEDQGGPVLATTLSAQACTEAEGLQASQAQHIRVEPGWRWRKKPAALAPVWRANPARSAALARLTVRGVLVSSLIPRQVRLSLGTSHQPLPPTFKGLG